MDTVWILILLNFNYERKYKSSHTVYNKRRSQNIELLFKAKCHTVTLDLAALSKRNFPYETFSSNFLRSRPLETLWVANVKDYTARLYCQWLTMNLTTCTGANKIAALKKSRNNPSEMFYKTGILKSFAKILRLATGLKEWLQLKCFTVN